MSPTGSVPCADLLAALDLESGKVVPLVGRSELFRCEFTGGPVIVKRHAHGGRPEAVEADLVWLHDFLSRLSTTGFPAPVPVPALRGASTAVLGDSVWEALTYLPGTAIDWLPEPDLELVGGFLAWLHDAIESIAQPDPRPTMLPLDALASVDPDRAAAVLGTTDWRALAMRLDRFRDDLEAVGHADAPRGVIHGDFTNHNVLCNGSPSAPCGVIDFSRAHNEAVLADLSFGIWRSGRPSQASPWLDLAKLTRFVRGYHLRRPLSSSAALPLAVYLEGRGLQMAVARVRSGVADLGSLLQVDWLHENRLAVCAAVSAAIS